MDKLRARRLYADEYRAALGSLGLHPPTVLQIARAWFEAGVPAGQAAQWSRLGYLPGEAARSSRRA